MQQDAIERLFSHLASLNPEPETELHYQSPFQLLVAVMLSAQSTDAGVNKATKELFRTAPTARRMTELGEDGIKPYISSLGLYNSKARHLYHASCILAEQHDGEVPRDRKALEALPGVGRKTANVLLNILFGEPTIAVDTHIFRVGNRTGLAPGKTPLEVERRLMQVVPKAYLLHAHHWLILHGRYTCIARKPRCPECPVQEECEWAEKTSLLR
ncbi:MAG: endonuclease III [Zetaproteobacteria bacterium CG_4_9_14_3_um_filter_49_83]|nr:MAG: endonuclease III [Zetaproteobacteria bacterium CG1_02_49_23]PIQ30023.1 MAG: endonuclease III [Zetaproteobacteria bacterium CG17_big_fil_post_rev_8_21_14_2_50_50_13]PIV30642.1 MAG: endonuclease III [Zetaproteobacteria bacterium CG02_land_8_20_14_3_00_50_9]PIY56029.1 MAG: endonuclease III [Zetaproteobacteria bacterium CG_4_10_14_0_8_um_filter_49_80]PJA36294.1 MAG: endonuclease III [Zetaproteobacteria bacterium CG_4_9_14_3_um_filter_49_83]